ncbi:MAG: YfhO family protein [Bacteroidales bacterium]|nr:YfhO family protein [Bacteroidales bacterium]
MSISPAKSKYIPHLTALVIIVLLTLVYFSPTLDNRVLQTHDTTVFAGSSKEIQDHREEFNEEPLWTNSMFGGMPAYLISAQYPGNLFKPIYNFLRAPGIPLAPILLLMAGFYLMLISFRLKPWLALLGSIAYGFSSYFFIILAAGHNTKAMALSFMAPVVGSIVYAYRRNRITGSVLTALFLTLQIIANHLQITYYTFIIVLVFGIVELISSIKNKQLPELVKTTLMLAGAAIIALAINFANLYVTYEYGKFSMRGKSELSSNQEDKTSGLDRSYATNWSYGIDETLTLLIPNIKGGASEPFDRDTETVKTLRQNNAGQYAQGIYQYWGSQPSTSGPVYVGAIIFLLFIMGLVLIKGPYKWWLLVATLLSIMLAWGKNFMFLTNLFFDFFPGYNKFRAVTMILVIAEFCMPLLAVLALDRIFRQDVKKPELIKAFKIGLGVTGGILLLFLLFPGLAGSFISPQEAQFPDWLRESLIADRKEMLRNDALRSLAFILAGSVIIYLAYNKKYKTTYAILTLALLLLLDLWTVNKRYLNNDNFVRENEAERVFTPTAADDYILRDTSIYRVLNLTVSPFNDGTTSYLHHSIGGYHGAKIRRYQDLIEHSIGPEINRLTTSLNSISSMNQAEGVFKDLNAINMLNTKYIIISPDNPPLVNGSALGNAWFVDSYRLAENPDEELEAVNDINPARELVVNEKHEALLNEVSFDTSAGGNIKLVSYKANELIYDYSAPGSKLLVFSEIYYPKGWNAYIDGEPSDHFRVNYVLRGMIVPGGKHEIVFRFEPVSYRTGNLVSLSSSIILFLILAVYIFYLIRRRKTTTEDARSQ